MKNGIFIYLWCSSSPAPASATRAVASHSSTSDRTYELEEKHLRAILNRLDASELIDTADTIADLGVFITREFMMAKYRIHEKTVHIEANDRAAITSDHSQITVNSHEMAVKVLRNFGHIMTKVSVNGRQMEQPALVDIYQAIDEHCSKSLYTIAFTVIPINPFATWTKPFEFVDTLALTHVLEQVVDIEVAAILPNLQTLDVVVHKAAQLSLIATKFASLHHFRLRLDNSSEENPFLMHFFDENPQLRSIDLETLRTIDDLHLVNRKLPNLQRFRLLTRPQHLFQPVNCENVVRFKNVREFDVSHIVDAHATAPCIPLTFDKLETLQLLTVKLTHQWMGFIVRHKTLRHISMPWVEPAYADLQTMLGGVPGLEQIDVQWMPKFGEPETNGVVRVMHEANSLRRVTIWMDARRDFSGDFRELVPLTWRTSNHEVRAQRRFITFERQAVDTNEVQR